MSNLLLDYQDYFLHLISHLSVKSCNTAWKHDLVIAGPWHWLPTFNFLSWRILICSSDYISVTLILWLGLIWFPVTSMPQYLMSNVDPDCWFDELVGLMSMSALPVYVHIWLWLSVQFRNHFLQVNVQYFQSWPFNPLVYAQYPTSISVTLTSPSHAKMACLGFNSLSRWILLSMVSIITIVSATPPWLWLLPLMFQLGYDFDFNLKDWELHEGLSTREDSQFSTPYLPHSFR